MKLGHLLQGIATAYVKINGISSRDLKNYQLVALLDTNIFNIFITKIKEEIDLLQEIPSQSILSVSDWMKHEEVDYQGFQDGSNSAACTNNRLELLNDMIHILLCERITQNRRITVEISLPRIEPKILDELSHMRDITIKDIYKCSIKLLSVLIETEVDPTLSLTEVFDAIINNFKIPKDFQFIPVKPHYTEFQKNIHWVALECNKEYANRQLLLLKRFYLTISSFLWLSNTENACKILAFLIDHDHFDSQMKLSSYDIWDIVTLTQEKCRELSALKTSSSGINSIKKFRIAQVPSRGGLPEGYTKAGVKKQLPYDEGFCNKKGFNSYEHKTQYQNKPNPQRCITYESQPKRTFHQRFDYSRPAKGSKFGGRQHY